MYRLKLRSIESWEKPTKFFFNLEKRNYTKKVITELGNENGGMVTDEKQILEKVLYSSKIIASNSDFN